jgi:hypothetical protein
VSLVCARYANRMTRRTLLFLAAFVALAAFQATNASADGYCPAGRVCMWEDSNYQGSRYVDVSGTPGYGYEIDWWNGDNEISSIDNASGSWVNVFDGDGYTGRLLFCVAPHQRIPDLYFSDMAESFSVTSWALC